MSKYVIDDALEDSGGGSVIVVTDKLDTRRVHALWTELNGGRETVVVHGLGDSFEPVRWWKTSDGVHTGYR